MVRTYFNIAEESPLVWSVDFGTVETEVKVREIRTHSVSGRYVFNPEITGTEEPKAWVEYPWSFLLVKDGIANIYRDPDLLTPRVLEQK